MQERGMSTRYLPYNPDQAYLLPPNVKDVLGEDHLVFFVQRVVERLDLEEFTRAYGEEGGAWYAPELWNRFRGGSNGCARAAYARFPVRIRRVVFAQPGGLATGLLGRDRGERRSSDRGPAGAPPRQRQIEAYVPDANLSYELKGPGKAPGIGRSRHLRDPEHRQMRRKLRSREGQKIYRQRQAIVEPVFGVLKQQRGLRQFRLRGLEQVGIEFTLAAIGYNLSRLHHRAS